jgi:hypothetical protein
VAFTDLLYLLSMKKNLDDVPFEDYKHVTDFYCVAPKVCGTCPWREDGGILHDDDFIRDALIDSFTANVCHEPALIGRPRSVICRSARNNHIEILHEHGFLLTPTDESFRIFWEKLSWEDIHALLIKLSELGAISL